MTLISGVLYVVVLTAAYFMLRKRLVTSVGRTR